MHMGDPMQVHSSAMHAFAGHLQQQGPHVFAMPPAGPGGGGGSRMS
jgi:hypothetical protein